MSAVDVPNPPQSPWTSVLKSPPGSPKTSNSPSAAPATSNSTTCNPPTSQSKSHAQGLGPSSPLPSPCCRCFDRWMSVKPAHPLYDLPDCIFSSKRGRRCDKCAITPLPDAVLQRLPRLLRKKSRLEREHRRFLKQLRYVANFVYCHD